MVPKNNVFPVTKAVKDAPVRQMSSASNVVLDMFAQSSHVSPPAVMVNSLVQIISVLLAPSIVLNAPQRQTVFDAMLAICGRLRQINVYRVLLSDFSLITLLSPGFHVIPPATPVMGPHQRIVSPVSPQHTSITVHVLHVIQLVNSHALLLTYMGTAKISAHTVTIHASPAQEFLVPHAQVLPNLIA